MTNRSTTQSVDEDDDFVRLPGLFRRWEIEQVVDPDAEFHIEGAGTAFDGTDLFAVYRRDKAQPLTPKET
jgi:hypothetical protein